MRARSTLALGAVLATALGGFAAGTEYAGDTRATPPATTGEPRDRSAPSAPPVTPAAAGTSDLAPPESCEGLLEHYVSLGVDMVGPWGWEHGGYPVPLDGVALSQRGDVAGAERVQSPAEATSSATGTNVQEAGVDEPDVVKTDGEVLYRVERNDLTVHDVSGDRVRREAGLELPDLRDAELLLVGDTLLAIGHPLRGGGQRVDPDGAARLPIVPPPTDRPWTAGRMVVVDVSDPSTPQVAHTATYDGEILAARQHGDVVRLVVRAGPPELDFVHPGKGLGPREARAKNREMVHATELSDWLPTVTFDDAGAEPLVECTDVAVPADGNTLGTMVTVGFDASDPATVGDRGGLDTGGVAVDTDLVYASADRLHLAVSPGWGWWDRTACCLGPGGGGSDGSTTVHAFHLVGTSAVHTASGQVDGQLRDRWSMDASDGVLRLALGATSRTGNFNTVLTLREQGGRLVEAGRVEKLGINEDITAVRWFDDLAFVVTFRRIDPVYAVDLSDPEHPELLGELKIPGFSAYLHPLGDGELLGLGRGPTGTGQGWGAQAGLFDVADLSDVRRVDVHSYAPHTDARATADPRQFTWLPDRRTALTVIVDHHRRGQVGHVSVLEVADGRLSGRMVEVEHGSEVDAVRLVPLPDGRVVLATGDGAEFFDVSPAG